MMNKFQATPLPPPPPEPTAKEVNRRVDQLRQALEYRDRPRMDWSPFKVVAEIPAASVVSFPSYRTHDYPRDAWGTVKPGAELREHKTVVLWDRDHDERVLHILAKLMYAFPRTASRVSAIEEHHGEVTFWAAWVDAADWAAFDAACNTNVNAPDYFLISVRELVLPSEIDTTAPELLRVKQKTSSGIEVLVDGKNLSRPERLGLSHEDKLVSAYDTIHDLGSWK